VCWKGQWEELEEEQWNLGDVMEFGGGAAPAWRENIKGGYKIKMVRDSGACRTVVPPETVPGMIIKENSDTGRNFRAANGKLFPNYGQTELEGKSVGGGRLNINAQVADVTKPLSTRGEIVDGGSWVIRNKKGGAIVKLDEEGRKGIEKIVKSPTTVPISMKTEKGTFVLEMIIPKKGQEKVEQEEWKQVKNGRKQKVVPMEVDSVVGRSQWEAFRNNESIFPRPE